MTAVDSYSMPIRSRIETYLLVTRRVVSVGNGKWSLKRCPSGSKDPRNSKNAKKDKLFCSEVFNLFKRNRKSEERPMDRHVTIAGCLLNCNQPHSGSRSHETHSKALINSLILININAARSRAVSPCSYSNKLSVSIAAGDERRISKVDLAHFLARYAFLFNPFRILIAC